MKHPVIEWRVIPSIWDARKSSAHYIRIYIPIYFDGIFEVAKMLYSNDGKVLILKQE